MLGMGPRALCMLGKCSANGAIPQVKDLKSSSFHVSFLIQIIIQTLILPNLVTPTVTYDKWTLDIALCVS